MTQTVDARLIMLAACGPIALYCAFAAIWLTCEAVCAAYALARRTAMRPERAPVLAVDKARSAAFSVDPA